MKSKSKEKINLKQTIESKSYMSFRRDSVINSVYNIDKGQVVIKDPFLKGDNS